MKAFGPLFRHELRRLARRGLQPKVRAAFAGLLLAALLATYLQSFPGVSAVRLLTNIDAPMEIHTAARFGERFLIWFLTVQLLVVGVITPVVAGAAIAEERDRGTLDFLLSSPLSAGEIVLGKMAARMVFVFGLLLTGLPVLALTMFFGGVDGVRLLAGYAVTAASAFSLAALTLLMVVEGRPFAAVLLRVYLLQLGFAVFGFCCSCIVLPAFLSPFAAVCVMLLEWFGRIPDRPEYLLAFAGTFVGLHLIAGAVWLGQAVVRLRADVPGEPPRLPPAYNPPRDDDLPPIYPDGVPQSELTRPAHEIENRDPFEWKEEHFGPKLLPLDDTATALGFLLVAVGLLFVFGVTLFSDMRSVTLVRVSLAAPLLVAVCGCGAAACHSVAGERSKGTLVPLLSLPAARRDVLWAKVRHAGRVPGVLLWGVTLMLIISAAVLAVSPVAMCSLPFTVLGWYGFALGAGMWVSVRAATPGRAAGVFLGAALVLAVLPPLFSPLFGPAEPFLDGLSPAVGVWNAVPDVRNPETAYASVSGACVAAFAGGGLWRAAVRRFETIGE